MAMGMVGSIFGINGDGKLSCMDKVVGYGFASRSWKNRRRGAGAEYFASRAHRADPAGRAGDEAICAQVGCAVKLIIAGLHEDALRAMDDQSRWEVLEQAGLDPEEYDYLED